MADIVERLRETAKCADYVVDRETAQDAIAEIERLRARVTELEGQHKGLVLNNAILRERPDLPLNRIPATRAMTKLYEDNERLRAALEQIADTDPDDGTAWFHNVARAALDYRKMEGRT